MLVEVSASGTPTAIEPEEARLVGLALDEAAAIADQARPVNPQDVAAGAAPSMRSEMMEPGRREAMTMAHPERAARRVADPEHVSLRELARRQGVRPVESADDLAADGAFDSDEELAEFLAAVQEWRHADPV